MDLGKADKMKMTYEQAVSYLYEIPKFTKKNGLEHTKAVSYTHLTLPTTPYV